MCAFIRVPEREGRNLYVYIGRYLGRNSNSLFRNSIQLTTLSVLLFINDIMTIDID